MADLVIFGTGKIADAVFRYVTYERAHNVVGFTCDAAYVPQDGKFHDLPAVSFDEVDRTFPPDRYEMLVAIGYQELNGLHARKCAEAKAKGYHLASFISSRAFAGDWLEMNENCIILDNVSIEPGARLGADVAIWSNVTIGHHSSVGDHCWLSANAVLGGHVDLGASTFVGLGATVGHEAIIGAESFLGAGVVVTKCAEPKSVFIDHDTKLYRLDSARFLQISKMQ